MTDIASPHNPRLKALRRLQGKRERARSGTFMAEGEDLIAAAALAGRPALEGYRARRLRPRRRDFHEVEPAALAAASTLARAPG